MHTYLHSQVAGLCHVLGRAGLGPSFLEGSGLYRRVDLVHACGTALALERGEEKNDYVSEIKRKQK